MRSSFCLYLTISTNFQGYLVSTFSPAPSVRLFYTFTIDSFVTVCIPSMKWPHKWLFKFFTYWGSLLVLCISCLLLLLQITPKLVAQKTYKIIILQFCESEVPESHRPNISVLQGYVLSESSRGQCLLALSCFYRPPTFFACAPTIRHL